jgi:valyl-tRNA synthetase
MPRKNDDDAAAPKRKPTKAKKMAAKASKPKGRTPKKTGKPATKAAAAPRFEAQGAYEPAAVESAIYEFWDGNGLFTATVDREREPYCIVIPPPNVTGALHMGHALNNTIQDVMTRFHRQLGREALWVPGTDHAGIATQSVVERRLHEEEGKSRHDLGRTALVERIWAWKEEYEARILSQLRKLGCSCDWTRLAFTMDENLSAAVRHVFIKLFEDGLIYRGKRLINWSVGLRTALSNDELDYKDVNGSFWHLRYPLADGPVDGIDAVQVATTRPETMLGDTAVAVHPEPRKELEGRLKSSSESVREEAQKRLDDAEAMARLEAFAGLIGKEVELPLTGRRIPIIGDAILADPAKGTGAVKVTPAHDPNDYACGQRNNLPMINIIHDDGTLNDEVPEAYRGLFGQKQGRKKVVDDLDAGGFLIKTESHTHSVAHCYRSHTVVEPYLSDQWFVKMQPLVDLARDSVKNGHVRFIPESRERVFFNWLDSTPDWCISRQLWWGHRIPVWYNADDPNITIVRDADGEVVKIEGEAEPILPPSDDPDAAPTTCPRTGSTNLVQDPDMLDTWFSSQLWPMSVLGWPHKTDDFNYFYPTNLLSTARDIIALWVARMIMMGEKFAGELGKDAEHCKPFDDVYIHGTILDEHGDIMSKSRGNGFDPAVAIDGGSQEVHAPRKLHGLPKDRIEHFVAHGADAVRYALMGMCTQGQDIRLKVERTLKVKKGRDGLPEYDVTIPRFEEGRRFCNKIWQASNGVVFANLQPGIEPPTGAPDALEDRWLADRLRRAITTVTDALRDYRLSDACDELYRLFWNDFCSFYLEVVKPRLRSEDAEVKSVAQQQLYCALDIQLRLMQPIMPHIAEALWQELTRFAADPGADAGTGKGHALCVGRWPEPDDLPADADARTAIDTARDVIAALNGIRAEQAAIGDRTPLPTVLITGNDAASAYDVLRPSLDAIGTLARAESIDIGPGLAKPKLAASAVVRGFDIIVPLEGVIDLDAERARLTKEIDKVREFAAKLEKKLSNANYVDRAPADVVQRDRDQLADRQEALARLERSLAELA